MIVEPNEKLVLDKFLAGDHPLLSLLRQQASIIKIKSRYLTGVGFFTEFSLPPNAIPLPPALGKAKIDDVMATVGDSKIDVGFILYIKDGLIQMLEGYTFEDSWPEKIDDMYLYYSDPDRNDLLAFLGTTNPNGEKPS